MAKRTTLSLSDDDERVIAAVTDPNGRAHAVLAELTAALDVPLPRAASEAAIIRALVQVGAHAVMEQTLDRGYSQLAELWDEIHDGAETRERRRRYAERVDRVMP